MAILSWLGPAQAALTLKEELSAASFFVGEGFVWSIAVQGIPAGVDEPTLPDFPGFYVRPMETRVVESKETRFLVYRYRLIPQRAGSLALPTLAFGEADNEVSTAPRTIEVGAARQTDDLRLEVVLDRAEVFVGEPLVLTFSWYTALPPDGIKALDIRMPLLYHPGFDLFMPEEERRAGGKPGTIGLPVDGQRVVCAMKPVEINEKSFQVLQFKRILVPRESGAFTFPPTRLLCSALQSAGGKGSASGNRYPSYFDNDFFHAVGEHDKYIRYGVQSEEARLQVKPLPEEGRPMNFSGLVGSGSMKVAVEPIDSVLGEPLSLAVWLEDFAHPEVLVLPALAAVGDFTHQFYYPDYEVPGRVVENRAVFLYPLRALNTGITQVPPLSLAIFDPATGKYRTLASDALAIKVRPDGEVTQLQPTSVAAPGRKPLPDGIWHNLPADFRYPPAMVGYGVRRFWLLWLILPPLVAGLLIKPARNYRLKLQHPEAWRRQEAFRVLQRVYRAGGEESSWFTAVRRYFADRLGLREGALSFREIIRALERHRVTLDEQEHAVLSKLFEGNEWTVFARQGTAPPALPDKQTLYQVLEKLEGRLSA